MKIYHELHDRKIEHLILNKDLKIGRAHVRTPVKLILVMPVNKLIPVKIRDAGIDKICEPALSQNVNGTAIIHSDYALNDSRPDKPPQMENLKRERNSFLQLQTWLYISYILAPEIFAPYSPFYIGGRMLCYQ